MYIVLVPFGGVFAGVFESSHMRRVGGGALWRDDESQRTRTKIGKGD
jgi:hypothetical protein